MTSAQPVSLGVASDALEELWFGEDDPAQSRSAARHSLAEQMARIQGLRPFPVAAGRLIRLLSDPGFDQREVVEVLESDPGLAAKTLAVANSPLFRSRVACNGLDTAIKRLGARNLRDIAIGVSAMSMFSDAAGIGVTLRDHSVGVGAVARILADLAAPSSASTLFLAGLLHDVGKLLLIQTGELSYEGPAFAVEETTVLEREMLGYDHAVLGGSVMKLWRIPDPVSDVIAWHHQPGRALELGGDVAITVALLRAADRIDELLIHHEELDDACLHFVVDDVAWSYADLGPGDLRQLWPIMQEARRETLAALGA
jgi:HD-like signal output (HDOD) protein